MRVESRWKHIQGYGSGLCADRIEQTGVSDLADRCERVWAAY
jgi:hypothetical protein